jgi:predicted transcriptional regulator of viral defense system
MTMYDPNARRMLTETECRLHQVQDADPHITLDDAAELLGVPANALRAALPMDTVNQWGNQ